MIIIIFVTYSDQGRRIALRMSIFTVQKQLSTIVEPTAVEAVLKVGLLFAAEGLPGIVEDTIPPGSGNW